MSAAPRRRFWTDATAEPVAGGHGVRLDARPLNTPDGNRLAVPTAALADAIAAEWAALEGDIVPDKLPLTRAANVAIDRVPGRREPVIDAIAAYGESDLICYRADRPAALARRQAEAWDPWLEWARDRLAAPLIAVEGVMPHPQPPKSLRALRDAVAGEDSFALTALHELVTLSGSLVLGLAVSRRALAAPEAWELACLDETWQAEQWGVDAEAEAAAARRRTDFLRADRLLRLLADAG